MPVLHAISELLTILRGGAKCYDTLPSVKIYKRSFLPPQPSFNDTWIIWRKVIIFKTPENSSVMSTEEIFFLQLLLGRHFESAQQVALHHRKLLTCDLMPYSIHN